ncbi:MAG: hypothetical protein D6732_24515 [Methanobacteriota archaeon]|nr:MAG: hypothetical protein D6732_24515 [Euryarchaeota archaeon]
MFTVVSRLWSVWEILVFLQKRAKIVWMANNTHFFPEKQSPIPTESGSFCNLLHQCSRKFPWITRLFIDPNIQILAAIFIALIVAVPGFAYWDRRTIIRKAKEETIAQLEREGRIGDHVTAWEELLPYLRDKAEDDKKLAAMLRKFHLM